jgi:glycosyltransferase involved in cell wall biosynthesis
MPDRPRRIAVIGHPLAAEENRLAFQGWEGCQVDLIVPLRWKARSLGHTYQAPSPYRGGYAEPSIHPLATFASGRNSCFLWIGLGPLLRRLQPDALYCWEEPWCLSTWQVARQARSLRQGMGIPLFCYSAENRPKRLPWPFPVLQRWAFSRYRACIVPTAEISACIRASGFPGRVFVIPLWIRSRRGLRADAAARTLAYVGRLIPLKRVHLLVESLALLPGYRLRIIGDGPERGRLEALAGALGLSERVEFPGHVGNAGLESALAGTSVLVIPTAENPRQAEQFGKAAVEGVSLGLPVLASRTGNLAALAARFTTLSARDLDTPAQVADAVAALCGAYPGEAVLSENRLQAEADYGHRAASRRLQAAFGEILDAMAKEPVP